MAMLAKPKPVREVWSDFAGQPCPFDELPLSKQLAIEQEAEDEEGDGSRGSPFALSCRAEAEDWADEQGPLWVRYPDGTMELVDPPEDFE